MRKNYIVQLTEEEREYLHKLISSGTAPTRKLNRARILLKADIGKHTEGEALIDKEIARMLETSPATVQRVRERFYKGGLEAALERSLPDRVYKRSLEGRAEAHLIALACSEPPRGWDRWSFRLLADKAVELGIVESVSHETVRKTLKKRTSPLPPQAVGDPSRAGRRIRVEDGSSPEPLLRALRSETPCRLLRRETLSTVGRGERSAADGAREGQTLGLRVRAEGYGSRAHGLRASQGLQKSEGDRASPKGGVRRNDAPPRRRSLSERREDLLGGRQPQSTHTAAAFYESFPPEQARRLANKIEFVYTPVHGSWMNMVEIELSVLVRQCLKGRIPDMETLGWETEAWCEERNRLGTSVDWRFTTADARIKLRKLYPSIDD